MALNQYRSRGTKWFLPVAMGALAGSHVQFGSLNGVLLTDADGDDNAWVDFAGDHIAYDLSVTGADDMGNAAVAVGDVIYNDGGTLNVDAANGVEYGIALEAVTSGATATIGVLVI